MIPGFHGFDLIVIVIVALIIFGPKRLPEMGSAIGKTIKEFRKSMAELTQSKEDETKEVEGPTSLVALKQPVATTEAHVAEGEESHGTGD